jgi:hypothetical protein
MLERGCVRREDTQKCAHKVADTERMRVIRDGMCALSNIMLVHMCSAWDVCLHWSLLEMVLHKTPMS